jgi:hypothetical protein
MQTDQFEFIHDPLASDGELTLQFTECTSAGASIFGVPMYTFAMRHAQTGENMGRIRLRVGWNEESIRFAGQIGYLVEQEFRGNHYAERACRLIAPLARRHGLSELWITCQPENLASRRTLCILIREGAKHYWRGNPSNRRRTAVRGTTRSGIFSPGKFAGTWELIQFEDAVRSP